QHSLERVRLVVLCHGGAAFYADDRADRRIGPGDSVRLQVPVLIDRNDYRDSETSTRCLAVSFRCDSGTGVSPVNYAQDARATFKMNTTSASSMKPALIIIVLFVLALLIVSSVAAQKMTTEELVTRHLEAIGNARTRAGITS